MHPTNTKTIGSVVSELKTPLRNVLAWYGTLVRLVRTFKQRTNVPYSCLHKKRVPHKRTVLLCRNWGVPYLRPVPQSLILCNFQIDQMFEIAPIDVAGNLDYKALCYIITHGQEEE